MINRKITIAVDGHSSCGKSTLAKAVALNFAYNYIDSGAMYRAITLYAVQNKLIDSKGIKTEILKSDLDKNLINIEFRYQENLKKSDTFLNGKNVEHEIRGIQISDFVSLIAELKFVREKMVFLQQEMGWEGGIVMDGRDIGTVVFPNAELKIFLTAEAHVRAQRRFKELTEKGDNVSFDEILNNLTTRDRIDSEREESPLVQAADAVVIDNSFLTLDEQNQKVFQLVEERLKIAKI
jgi:cytidylate kinase